MLQRNQMVYEFSQKLTDVFPNSRKVPNDWVGYADVSKHFQSVCCYIVL